MFKYTQMVFVYQASKVSEKEKSGKPLCSGPRRFLEHLIAANK